MQLGEDANIWRKIAIISDSREVDRDDIIANCELTVTPRCLMDRKQTLYSGYPGKSKLFTALKAAAGEDSTTKLPFVDCVGIDGFCMLHNFEKSSSVKTGKDLADAVCSWEDRKTQDCSTVSSLLTHIWKTL